MDWRLSLYLDFLRCLAAMTVFMAHFFHVEFGEPPFDPIHEFDYGSDAVILFFVLSGFVIAHTAQVKDTSGASFLFARATRIFSVAIPALILTALLDQWGGARDPALYAMRNVTLADPAQFVMFGLTLTNEWAFAKLHLGTNHPLWSLSYEAAYYLLFFAAFYLAGWRRIAALAALCIAAGLNVMLLFPAWALGVAARYAIARERAATLSVFLFAGSAAVYFLTNEAKFDSLALYLTNEIVGGNPYTLFRHSAEFAWSTAIAGLAAIHLAAATPVLRLIPDLALRAVERPVRWFAAASFSIYAVHYPVFMAIATVLPDDISIFSRLMLQGGGALAICLVFAAAFERPLPHIRAGLLRLKGA